MEQQKISRRDMLKFAFNTLIDNFGFWIGLILTQLAIVIATVIGLVLVGALFLSIAPNAIGSALWFLTAASITIYMIYMFMTGNIQIDLDFYDTKNSFISRLWSANLSTVVSLFIATLLYITMVVIGLVFVIIPGIYLAVKFWFYGQIIVDKKMGPLTAFKESSNLTHSRMLELFIIALIIGLLGCIPFVGVLLSVLCTAYVYRQLAPRSHAFQQSPNENKFI